MSEEDHSSEYLAAAAAIATALDVGALDEIAGSLAAVRAGGGRLFILGVGGGAGHASRAANDFRKLCALESYAPTDNICELTARTNDDGWESTFTAWLEVSRLNARDALLVFSVGGGSREGAGLDASRLCLHHPHGVVPTLAGPCPCRKPECCSMRRTRCVSTCAARGLWKTPTPISPPAAPPAVARC